ncbi:PTS fructose transporter subunit IIA [Salipaludibacillus keqinensis]|uniref:PTS fructose transporter subunit IIA n=1 Tax=Salipaludibacillus keqinensis TaxID=2045207 RepID=A0A323TI49_9BACI|nr:PTS fructose transporter subunit IIABC [Salipaludibacillus keqinensis]PYZ93846.1 PTS fructose transporter subunit IIA [Salipaludibacillus keqinensis]
MKITELLTKETMILDLVSVTKDDAIDELATKLDRAGKLRNKENFVKEIHQREEQSSTGIGEGIAIPHAKSSSVHDPAIVFGRSKCGVDYDSLDGEKSHLFFMIAASEGANDIHLQTLSRLSTLLMDESFRETLMNASSEEEILKAVDLKEKEKLDSTEKENSAQPQRGRPFIIAVTGCPTGIAHTYMAADGLKDKAKELGYDIKVETNGSDGVRNKLTADDIRKADAVIIAADTDVEKGRFSGKKMITAPVTAGIRRPAELLEKAASGNASIYQGGESSGGSDEEKDKRPAFYRHLMNGVSNMLPFVVGGGILIALSFFFEDPVEGEITAFGEILATIGGGNAFFLMVPVLAGFIAMSIADRPGLAAGMVGGLMAANGDAGFLGGIIAGFLAGYLVLGLRRVFAFVPTALDGIRTILLLPLFGIFLTGLAMYFLVTPLSAIQLGLVNWLGDLGTGNIVLLGILLGAMMAVDMGGPINKAAFTFGIAMIEAGNFAPHAAIMAGGMVPPLGIALATTFFKNKFTTQEKDAGKTNYVLGASFITEGAIPFAASDPGRVIPSIIAGSAVAGGLAMMVGASTEAPHGGIFVIPLVNNWPMYIVAILAGAAVTALLLGLWKKKIVA